MAAKAVKKELLNDDIKEFGEDAATAINELLGLYGYDEDNKRTELSVKFHRNSCKKIANISQKLLESKRQMRSGESESLRSTINDYSSISSDKDSSSRENSKSPLAMKHAEKDDSNCSWCHQDISQHSTEIIGSQGTVFCSENCFLSWRRASFKRAKTCDFCKSVRNAVSYVDFNDGATQLQFCSDKCLNQYKMQIFCRETQAHLELNPHLKEKKDGGENLITPDLWLRNCRTRSPSPDASRTPTPSSAATANEQPQVMPKIIVTQSQPSSSSTVTSSSVNLSCDNGSERSKKPLINVLPSSKLLSRNMFHHKNLRKRRASARLALNSKPHQNPSNGANPSGSERIMNTNFPSDLRAKIHSQMNNNSPKQLQPTNFNRPPLQFMQRPPFNLFKFRPPFHNFPSQRMPPPAPPDDPNHNHHPGPLGFNSLVPPPVILVPHPILVPIIIPVPLPLSAFWAAYQTKKSPTPPRPSEHDNESHRRDDDVRPERATEENEQPLDYTTSKTPETYDNNSPLHDDNENNGIDSISSDRVENSSNGNNAERIRKFKITRLNMKRGELKDSQDYVNESNRPLRKRRIIAEVDNFSESS